MLSSVQDLAARPLASEWLAAAAEVAQNAQTERYAHHPYAWLAGFVIVLGFGVGVPWVRRPSGKKLRDAYGFLLGEDNRRSTSKLVFYVWLLALAGGLAMLLVSVGFGRVTLQESNLQDLQAEYLILMGSPLAGLVLGKGITEAKVTDGNLQKPPPDAAAGFKAGGFTADDRGRLDIVDVQYLAFNAILLVYFAASVIYSARVPELPATLVGLTGAAAAAYIANKAVAANPPSIEAITWSPVPAGAQSASAPAATHRVHIRGRNLLRPENVDQAEAVRQRVQVSGQAVLGGSWASDEMIDASLAGQPSANAAVAVTTAAGATVSSTLS